LAETIAKCETETNAKAKAAAEARCVKLILLLWEKRHNLPAHARPLGSLQQAVDVLVELHPSNRTYSFGNGGRFDKTASPWLRFAKDLDISHQNAFSIAFLMGVVELKLGDDKQWLEEHVAMITAEERNFLNTLNVYLDTSHELFGSQNPDRLEAMTPETRKIRVLDELDSLLRRQQDLLQKLRASVNSALNAVSDPASLENKE
jgi:hypothetical protein